MRVINTLWAVHAILLVPWFSFIVTRGKTKIIERRRYPQGWWRSSHLSTPRLSSSPDCAASRIRKQRRPSRVGQRWTETGNSDR